MKKRIIPFYIIFAILLVYGVFLYYDPYLIAKNETVSTIDTWIQEDTKQAYFSFNLSSKAFITTNYPVTVQVKVVVFNLQLIPLINSRQYQMVSIINTEAYPIVYDPVSGLASTGNIVLTFDGNRSYEGSRTLIFPSIGTNYNYIFYTMNSLNDALQIYAENKSSPTSSAIPPFSIDEGYTARASFEQANKSNGISFLAVGITGVALAVYVQFETGKSRVNDFAEMENQLKKLNDTLRKFMDSYPKDKQKEKKQG